MSSGDAFLTYILESSWTVPGDYAEAGVKLEAVRESSGPQKCLGGRGGEIFHGYPQIAQERRGSQVQDALVAADGLPDKSFGLA